MASIPTPLEERNRARREIVEVNHERVRKIKIDVQLRSQTIQLGASAFAFSTPCRVVISGPTLRNKTALMCIFL